MDSKTRKCRVDFFAIGARLRHDSALAHPCVKGNLLKRPDVSCYMPSDCKGDCRGVGLSLNRLDDGFQEVSLIL